MTKKAAIATLTAMHQYNDNVVEYCDSQEWGLGALREELDDAEDVTTLMAIDYVIAVRSCKDFRFTESDLNAIAGV